MEWSSGLVISAELPADIIEWQKHDQIAYWKSKALVLELENKALRQHLKDVYAKSIEDYLNDGEIEEYPVSPVESGYTEGSYKKQVKNSYEKKARSNNNYEKKGKSNYGNKGNKKKQNYKKESFKVVSPNFPQYTNRSDELKKLYGEKSQKIIGMETALQLNYERHLEKSKAIHWPNIPLNL